MKVERQAKKNKEAEHHSCRKSKNQQPANQIPSFSSRRIPNIEGGKFRVDQGFKTKWIQEAYEDRDDQKSCVIPQTFFP